MNEDRLSDRERRDMRDILLAGTQRIRPAGQHRMQIIAGAVALVLIGGITGGAITTAALFGNQTVGPISTPTETAEVPSPSPTHSATPAPTPSEPEIPAEGIVPFGGQCENALTDAEVVVVTGMPMALSDYRWRTGAETVLGGIDCLWLSSEEYIGAQASVFAYPEAVVPASVREAAVPGCHVVEWDASKSECTAAGTVDGTWLFVGTVGDADAGTVAAVEALFDQAATRLVSWPAAAPATRTGEWWELPDCTSLAKQLDPSIVGYTKVASLGGSADGESGTEPLGVPSLAGVQAVCGLHFTNADGTPGGVAPQLGFYPGGAVDFSSAVAADGAVPVTVDGAASAVIVPGNDRYEGSWEVLLVSDGVNVLAVYSDGGSPAEDLVPLAEAVLTLM